MVSADQTVSAEPSADLLAQEEVTGEPVEELRQELDRLGLPDVGVKLYNTLLGQGTPVDGAFTNQTISIAMNPTRSRIQTLHHEAIHAFKEAGLFTESEWKALTTAAKKDWLNRKWPALQGKTVAELYSDMSPEIQIEEAIAVAFEHYMQKAFSPAGLVASAQKIANFFGRIRNLFTGKGYQTADDVFEFISSGAMRYKIRPGEVSIGPTKLAKAPEWVPQEIWDLHEKVNRADDEAEGRVPLRPNQRGQVPRPGDLKRNQTLAFRRLSNAVDKYVGDDSRAANDLMVRMNEESSRRAEKGEAKFAKAPNVQYHSGRLGYGDDTVLGRMDGGRGTGHFGTGVYFISDANKFSDVYKARGIKQLDLSPYNLFKVRTTQDGKDLHQALRLINRLASESTKPITPETAGKELREISYTLPIEIRLNLKVDNNLSADESESVLKAYAAEAAEEARKLYEDYRFERDFIDSASTRFMKKLGYDGVDVRGTDLDNTEYGTVVYAKDLSEKEKPTNIRFAKAPPVDTREFKRWFGDSKVVGPEGKPLVLYRGIQGDAEGALNAEPRGKYNVFASDSPDVAASYGMPDETFGTPGSILPIYVKADKLIEFPVTVDRYGSRRFDKIEFDRRARLLAPGEVLVARQVVDIGPMAREAYAVDKEKKYSYYSDVYALGRGTSV
ncbi:MAG: hypothetical protein EBR82_63850, partial [Caulobacteraceae bacterium]|nr:hypothetical protein [Caulobacteraceae bacterium]